VECAGRQLAGAATAAASVIKIAAIITATDPR